MGVGQVPGKYWFVDFWSREKWTKINEIRSLWLFADGSDGVEHAFFHALDWTDQTLIPDLFFSALQHFFDKGLNQLPDLPLAIPLIALDGVLVRLEHKILFSKVFDLPLIGLDLSTSIVLHFFDFSL